MPQLTVEGVGAFIVPDGKRLVLALVEDAGIDQLHACGGRARCTTCRVEFVAGEPAHDDQGRSGGAGGQGVYRRASVVSDSVRSGHDGSRHQPTRGQRPCGRGSHAGVIHRAAGRVLISASSVLTAAIRLAVGGRAACAWLGRGLRGERPSKSAPPSARVSRWRWSASPTRPGRDSGRPTGVALETLRALRADFALPPSGRAQSPTPQPRARGSERTAAGRRASHTRGHHGGRGVCDRDRADDRSGAMTASTKPRRREPRISSATSVGLSRDARPGRVGLAR